MLICVFSEDDSPSLRMVTTRHAQDWLYFKPHAGGRYNQLNKYIFHDNRQSIEYWANGQTDIGKSKLATYDNVANNSTWETFMHFVQKLLKRNQRKLTDELSMTISKLISLTISNKPRKGVKRKRD